VVATPAEAIHWRTDPLAALARGEELARQAGTVAEVARRFLAAVEDGTARSKKGKRYKPQAARDIAGALRVHVLPELGTMPVTAVRRRHVQRLVDRLAARGLSGSRIRTVVYALASLYRYTRTRDDVEVMPTLGVALPAIDEQPRDPVPTPKELDRLLDALALRDQIPFALAAFTTARRQEIRNLDWPHVDFELEQLVLADADDYAKSLAATRVVPMIARLRALLRAEWLRQGRPDEGLVCAVYRGSHSGRLSIEALYARCDTRWAERGLEPLRLHEARHAASSYLRRAGLDLKLRSVLMGHASASSRSMTEDRYTHLMPDEVADAKRALGAYLGTTGQARE
jgi:integrase